MTEIINNLKDSRCYMSFPIEFAGDDAPKITSYKENIIVFLKSKNVKVFDPKKISFRGITEIIDRKKLFEEENYEELVRQMKIIVRKDLRCVDLSDFTIAILPKDVKTTGTIHEIIEADRQKKPVLIYCPHGLRYIPAWLFGIIPLRFMFKSLNELINYLNYIDTYDDFHELSDDRWQFLSLGTLDKEGVF